MMHLNEHQIYRLNEDHREDLLRQMRQLRLAQAVQVESQPAHEAALLWLGGVLVTVGTKMQATAEREQPVHEQGYR
jgi:hypothetical protein